MGEWVRACAVDDIDLEDLIRFDHAGATYAVYRSPDDEFFATEGMCTHERTCLADGLVLGDIVDKSLRRGLVLSDGSLLPFFTRPISAVLALVVLLMLLAQVPAVQRRLAPRAAAASS